MAGIVASANGTWNDGSVIKVSTVAALLGHLHLPVRYQPHPPNFIDTACCITHLQERYCNWACYGNFTPSQSCPALSPALGR